ncbi:hypothetical protein [Mycobacterium simulans]|uniref:hypothetical protein n=1 Tax=Mycobacterium simulans TaxID=627089 RepID=UPI0017493A58|nr:hypothetical protein [Mycobacterium simulans]
MRRAPLVIGIAVVLVISALAIPIKQRCGAPGRTCATAVDAHGHVHYYYEIEPLGVFIIENVFGTNIRLRYSSGEEVVKTR